MWYNKNIPELKLTKGGIFMSKGHPNKYSPEFKIKVIETMHNEGLSHREAAKKFEIPAHDSVAKWERIYVEDASQQDVPQSLRKKWKKILSQRCSVFGRRTHT